jgi:hypothetical protein
VYFFCAVLSLIIISPSDAKQDVPPEVIKAAEDGLIFYQKMVSQPMVIKGKSALPTIPASATPSTKEIDLYKKNNPTASDSTVPSSKVIFGFKENDSLDQACLGEPFKFYQFNKEAILNYTKNSDVSSVLVYVDQWYFPVMIGNNARTILIVSKMKGLWKAVSFGGRTTFAVELDKIRKQWPLEQGYTPLLAEADYAYLFTVPQYDFNNLTVIKAAKDYSKLEDADKYIEELKLAMKK